MSEEFLFHLEEFRRRLIVVLVFFTAAAMVCFFYSHPLLDYFTAPLRRFQNVTLIFQQPHEAFMIHLQVAAFTALLLSTPLAIFQAWLFVAPGLYEHEKNIILSLVLSSSILFLVGAVFAFYVVIPWGLGFLLSFQTEGLKPMLAVEPYFSFLTGMILSCGIFFDFPVVIVGLVKLGVVETKTVARARRLVIVFIFIAAAVLTPTTDPVTQTIVALPMIFLFEASLWVARIIEKKREDAAH